MDRTIFKGVGTAIVTPFHEGGVDYEAFAKLIDFQIEKKADAIVVCGTTGESATMPDQEHLDVVRFCVSHVNGRVPVIAGTGSNDTMHAVELCKEAENAGADALLLVTPYYNKTTQKGLAAHYRYIASKTSLPIILYNVPSRTGLNISLDTLKDLSDVENIVAIKEASGNISFMAQIAAECPHLAIYSGNDDMTLPALSLGADGVISVASNILPEEMHDICELYFAGETERSRKLFLSLIDIMDKLFIEVNPIPVKAALNLMGMHAGILRMPLCEMSGANLEKLKAAMIGCGLKIQK